MSGAFATEEIFPYQGQNIQGQMLRDSCVAACCGMLLQDFGQDIPEFYLRDSVKVRTNQGAFLRDVPPALNEFNVKSNYQTGLSLDELRKATNNSPAIVVVITTITQGAHALIVDGFEADNVLIRNPLPELWGSSYQIAVVTFTKAWTGSAVIL